MMRILPILFNTEMVRAILNGQKTVTRRLVKPQLEDACPKCRHVHDGFVYDEMEENIYCARCGEPFIPQQRSPYQVGDILYVREAYCPNYFDTSIAVGCKCGSKHAYRTDYHKERIGDIVSEPKWRPSIHMPKEAARIWLKVTDVRVERLQEISNEQIVKEGARQETINSYIAQMPEKSEVWTNAAYALEWMQMWDSTVKKNYLDIYGWAVNPWVWVIEFERCERPEEEVK